MLKINMEYRKGILFVRLNGSMNRITSFKFNNAIFPVILKHGIRYLVFNLEELSDINASGLKSFELSKKVINNYAGKILLCNVPNDLEERFNYLSIKKTNNELKAMQLMNI